MDAGISRPGIGFGSNVHTQPAGKSRSGSTGKISNGYQRLGVYEDSQDDKHHHGEACQGQELAAQKGHGSGAYAGSNLLHAVVALALTQNRGYQVAHEPESHDSRQQYEYSQNQRVHKLAS